MLEQRWLLWCWGLVCLDGNTHVAAIATLTAVALIFADAKLRRNASVLAAPARPLAIAALLALTASLASRLAREIRLILITYPQHAAVGGNGRLPRSR